MTTKEGKTILVNSPDNGNLVNIICGCPDNDLKGKAWELLSTQHPTNDDLIHIIKYCPYNDLKNKAVELLLTQRPTNGDLIYIIRYYQDNNLKCKAWDLLLTQNPDNEDLRWIICGCSDNGLKGKAWELFATQNPTNGQLRDIICYCSDNGIKDKVAELLIPQLKKLTKKYKFKLIPKWEGRKMIWHAWHSRYKMYAMTYPEYIGRLVQINEAKDPSEHQQRYNAIKPVKGKFNEDFDQWDRSWNYQCEKENAALIEKYHEKECKHCGWNKKRDEMVFE